MTTGVALHAIDADNQIDATVRLAHEASAAGLRSAWFGQTFGADSPQLAAIVGREVPGLQVGTSAIPVFGRHPLVVSSQAQTAQAATHGRYHLGLALGTKLLTEGGFGIPFERPVARLREFLTALRQLTETGTADFHGELLTAHTPVPARVPGAEAGVPLLVAAMGPQALRASGELADGILPYLAGPRALAEHIVPAVTAAAQAAGRPAPRIVALVPGVVTDDVDAVREKVTEQLAFYEQIPSYARVIELSGGRRAADVAVIGDERRIADEVRRYRDAGATEVVFSGTEVAGDADRRRTWDVLGALAG
ncbi:MULTISPECIES: LLM class F420-dependent oxidoreductase [unclassified Streptomyces]|uniref:LLM class F420-dependent oxidoreductase n=1 Tax=Streptomyces TaxID=1883 RepID=UPI00031A42B9|nr:MULTISPECIES: LLM class F420-dependent oxidoreductase [unclassified Streptomyces]MYR69570.1 TIGR03564 family F420-dependent LLM class oxidoreductase [Streptomyces sp. SID4939]MYS01649.1 TIGR03564 family F420-dependent LLM class oxidoreductase [Streptomyces sp. SID4940]MYT66215.1 TIGR03564 family F420-dependent LLM class oxidoreductase [Streptomyces sp. SID8357]MYT83135.1 TIGR03564 family F420-dependent LLM class oxidoreductase [Streptomyces sp. SID8360]MYU33851.1 TIGR03564 family F420-depen